MNRIIYETEEGDLAVVMPASNTRLSIEEIAEKDVPEGRPKDFINLDQLPVRRIFRKAWMYDFSDEMKSRKYVEIDMEKARAVTQDIIREERRPILETLDIEYMRATEAKDESKMEYVAALKQILRDLPSDPRIEAAKTPDELEQLARNAVKEAVGK